MSDNLWHHECDLCGGWGSSSTVKGSAPDLELVRRDGRTTRFCSDCFARALLHAAGRFNTFSEDRGRCHE